jgi:hypothetical protein
MQVLLVVPVGIVHAWLQPPQWAVVLRRSVSQPLTPLLSQLPCVVAHTGVHTLATQALLVVPLPVAHTVPQALQFEESVAVFTQLPEQLVGATPPQQRLAPPLVVQVSPPLVQVPPGEQHTRPCSPQVAVQE